MAHPSVVINDVQYNTVPAVDIPKVGGGTATFYDSTDANAGTADVRNGKKFVNASGEQTGNMTEKAAATFYPSSTDQTINANQYLAGAQTIKKVVVTNLSAQYIAKDVVVKIGDEADDDRIIAVTGSLASPVVSQDSTTKVLSIS